MGDAARQLADRFHLLRLKELGFEFLPCLFGTLSLGDLSLLNDADADAFLMDLYGVVAHQPGANLSRPSRDLSPTIS